MNDLEAAVKQLAKYRQDESTRKAALTNLQTEIDTMVSEQFGDRIGRMSVSLDLARSNVTDQERLVKEQALQTYKNTGEAKPVTGIHVKQFVTINYDPAKALDYARVHLPKAVTLSKSKFEKAAKVLDLDFVTIDKEPRTTISRDLSGLLEGDGS